LTLLDSTNSTPSVSIQVDSTVPEPATTWSGAAIILLALAFNLVGDALRDILDPTQKGRH